MFNYGSTLSNHNDFEKSIPILESAKKIETSYELYFNLGRAYEGFNNDSMAEKAYKQAAFLIPNRFVPRYNLFKLYKRTNQINKAIAMAKEITGMKIKVYSQTVGNIQSEAIEYLNKNKVQ